MQSKKYSLHFDKLIEEALEIKEIKENISKTGFEKDYFKSKIEKKKDDILLTFSDEVDEFNRLNKQLRESTVYLPIFKKRYPRYVSFYSALFIVFVITIFIPVMGFDTNIELSIFASMAIAFMVHRSKNIHEVEKPEKMIIEMEEIESKIHRTILLNGILPQLRLLINEELKEAFNFSLPKIDYQGLAEVFEPKFEVSRKSKEKLARWLNLMPHGSLGITGSRGAGKTALIDSFCKSSTSTDGKIKTIPIQVSVPVKYESRDFILYLFLQVCEEVIKHESGSRLYLKRTDSSSILKKYKRMMIVYFVLTIFLITAGSYIFIRNYIAMLWQMNYLEHQIMLNEINSGIGFLLLCAAFITTLQTFRLFYFMRGITTHFEQASEWIDNIRFQSSYSSGWSGSLKLPMGLESNIKSAKILSKNQSSLPEIVNGYRDFVGSLARKYKFIIGIDELDKISSNEKAHQFLNEIKGIFNIENCYYLISLSENAMSAFERRGLPFRDAFDSSFDGTIYVDYLNLKEAKELIKKRVIGMPVPFMCFCFCMSGGLARELIRICRDIVDSAEFSSEKNNLANISRMLILDDMKSKIYATSMKAKNIELKEEVAHFINQMYNFEKQLDESGNALSYDAINVFYSNYISTENRESRYINENYLELVSLRKELIAYLCYAITLMEVFGDTEESHFNNHIPNAFEQLAKIRQHLSVNPIVAKSEIESFRIEHNMNVCGVLYPQINYFA
ncbi:P-loop NTPase fold protein [Methanolobus sp. ZRKC5]|uniref:P-loop NTPase fold protein n=1 Tax=unclassified Methanolobus TaxID=2629569 RepID=UPI00313E171E